MKKVNVLKPGQIYTLNDGETYDVIRPCWEDGSGGMCYQIFVMGGCEYADGQCIEWEDAALEEIREKGMFVGELGKTHEIVKGELREKKEL